jgi:hypothetical protein
LGKATKVEHRGEIPLKAIEVKWEAYMLPNANIPSNTVREFAAFFIIHEFPEKLNIANVWTDAPSYIFPKIEGEGLYELQYVVVSDNFPPSSRNVQAEFESLAPFDDARMKARKSKRSRRTSRDRPPLQRCLLLLKRTLHIGF